MSLLCEPLLLQETSWLLAPSPGAAGLKPSCPWQPLQVLATFYLVGALPRGSLIHCSPGAMGSSNGNLQKFRRGRASFAGQVRLLGGDSRGGLLRMERILVC